MRILGGGVPPGSSNLGPISDQNDIFLTRLQTWPLRNYVKIRLRLERQQKIS